MKNSIIFNSNLYKFLNRIITEEYKFNNKTHKFEYIKNNDMETFENSYNCLYDIVLEKIKYSLKIFNDNYLINEYLNIDEKIFEKIKEFQFNLNSNSVVLITKEIDTDIGTVKIKIDIDVLYDFLFYKYHNKKIDSNNILNGFDEFKKKYV